MARNEKALIESWEADVSKHLKGRRIAHVRYMTDKEQKECGWFRKAIVIVLDNGHYFFPSADDEGNDAGALFTTFKELPTVPVI